MAKVVNLNRFRKRKEREDKERRAEANRLKHGVPKAERTKRDKIRELEVKRHHGRKLDKEPADADRPANSPSPTNTVASIRPAMPAPWTLERLLREITDLDRNTFDFRGAAALAAVDADQALAREKLLPYLEHPDLPVEYRAGMLLLHLRDPEGARWLFGRLRDDPRAALVDLAHGERFELSHDRVEREVLPLLQSADADVAVSALARYPTSRTTEHLAACLGHADRRVRELALRSLVFAGIDDLSPAERTERALQRMRGEATGPALEVPDAAIDVAIALLDDEMGVHLARQVLQEIALRAPAAQAERARGALAAISNDEPAFTAPAPDEVDQLIDALGAHDRFVIFDTEAIDVPPDYEHLLDSFRDGSAGAFVPTDVEQPSVRRDAASVHVAFRHRDRDYTFDAKLAGDWYDVDIALEAIHRALADVGAAQRFIELAPDGQCRRFVFATDAEIEAAHR